MRVGGYVQGFAHQVNDAQLSILRELLFLLSRWFLCLTLFLLQVTVKVQL